MPVVTEKYYECKCGHKEEDHKEIEHHEYYYPEGQCYICDCKKYKEKYKVKIWSNGKVEKILNLNFNLLSKLFKKKKE